MLRRAKASFLYSIGGETLGPFQLLLSDDTDRVIRMRDGRLPPEAMPVDVEWPFFRMAFRSLAEARLSLGGGGPLARVPGIVRDAMNAALDQLGCPSARDCVSMQADR